MDTPKALTVHFGLKRNNAHLSYFINQETTWRQFGLCPDNIDRVLVWGSKPSLKWAKRVANKHHLPLLRLEDGFLRSLDGGIKSRHAASMVVDDLGIYFDTRQPSRLEQLIINTPQLKNEQLAFATTLIEKITSLQLSKYNLAPAQTLQTDTEENVLVVDQTFGDQSVVGSGAHADSFQKMLDTALTNHPDATVWVKTHPQSKKSSIIPFLKKQKPVGYFTEVSSSNRIKVVSGAFNPISLIQQVDAVYVVSSHMGFEALMCGKPVHCFGVPWYSGWGLTHDDHAPQPLLKQVLARRQHQKVSLQSLFYHAYINYSRYVNPATASRCELDGVIQWLITNRHWQQLLSLKPIDFYKLSAWKVNFIPDFLSFPEVRWHLKYFGFEKNQKQKCAVAWGQKNAKRAAKHYADVWCMEDGFIRSRGLGASLIAPTSVVLDSRGIYYDSTSESDLEHLLNTLTLTPEQENRTRHLIQRLLSSGVSKYNVGSAYVWPHISKNRQIILVPGQVEDDASVQLSQSAVKTNLQLLKAVRENEPKAFVIYKPHPDVQAKLRKGYIAAHDIKQYADAVVDNIDMPNCLARVDAVHTISSLTGFEALLRGVKVTCYGLPFYAGWGLTEDKVICKRRVRKHNLNTLVYAALIRYPIYFLPYGNGLAEVEDAIDYLEKPTSTKQQKQWQIAHIMQLRHRFLAFLSRMMS